MDPKDFNILEGGPSSSNESPYQSSIDRLDAIADSARSSYEDKPLSYSLGDIQKGLDRYPVYNPSLDNEDIYGTSQAWYSKAVNGILKGGALTATTFLTNTAGLLNGVFEFSKTGKFSSLYDNDTNRYLDGITTQLENDLPNYTSEVERNAEWYSPKNLLTANFIFDKVIKNMGFAIGTIASANLYSSILKGIPATAKLFGLGKSQEALSITEKALKTGDVGSLVANMDKAVKAAETYNNILNPGFRAVVSGLSTFGEASIEALGVTNSYRQSLIDDYVRKNGSQPMGDELEAINESAEKVGNSSFLLNTMLLSATNYVQLPKLLGSSYKAEKNAMNKIVTGNITKNKEGLYEEVSQSVFGKNLRKAKNVSSYLFNPVEGFEEGSQFVIESGTQNFFRKKYRGEDASFTADLLGEGVDETLNSKEGLESILLGGISGAIMTGRSTYSTQQAKKLNTQNLIQALNRHPSLKFSNFTKDSIDSINRDRTLQAQRDAAIRQGDILEALDLEVDLAFNYMLPRVKYGRTELIYEEIKNYREIASSDEGFAQLKQDGIATEFDTKETFIRRLDALQRNTFYVDKLYNTLNLNYSAITDDSGKPKYPPEIIDKLAYTAAKIYDYDSRIPELTNKLIEQGVPIGVVLDTIKSQKVPGETSVKDALNYIDNLDVLSDVKEDLKRELSDVMELVLRRQSFIDGYDSIKNNPKNFEDDESEASSEESDEGKDPLKEMLGDKFTDDEYSKLNDIILKSQNEGDITEDEFELYKRFSEAFQEYQKNNAPIAEGREYTREQGEYKVRKVPKEDKYNLIDNNKKVVATYDTKEEAEVQRDAENKKLDDMSSLNILRKTEAGLYEVRTKSGRLEYLTREQLIGYDIIKTQEEIAAENEKANRDLGEFQEDQNKTSGSEIPPGDLSSFGGVATSPVKSISTLFVSGTQNQKRDEDKPFIRNLNKFLADAYNLPNYNNLKVITVSKSNETYLGIPGVDNMLTGGEEMTTPISYLVVEQDGRDNYFINAEGERIGKVGEGLYEGFSNQDLIINTLPTESLVYGDNSPLKGQNRFYVPDKKGQDAQEEALAWQQAYKEKREQLLSQTDTYEIYDFNISRGVAERYEKGSDGRVPKNAVTDSLIPEDVIEEQIVIKVHTSKGGYVKGDDVIDFPLGALILDYGPTAEVLNNRRLTNKEAAVVYDILEHIATEIEAKASPKTNEMRLLFNYLQGILYTGEKESANRVWFDYKAGQYYIGKDFSIPLTKAAFQENRKEIIQRLSEVYTVANNKMLGANEAFLEIIGMKDGKPKVKTWDSYQEFLISPKGRQVTDIPFTTSIVNPAKFWNRYISASDLLVPPNISPKPQQPQTSTPVVEDEAQAQTQTQEEQPAIKEPVETEIKEGTYSFTTESGLKLSYNISEDGKLALNEDDGYKVAYEKLSNSPALPQIIQQLSEKFGEEPTVEQAIYTTIYNIALDDYTKKANIVEQAAQKPAENQPTTEEVKAVEEKAKGTTPGPRNARRRDVVAHWDYVVGNINQEKEWFEKRFNLPFHKLENLIKNTEGGYAWGMFKNNAVYVYQNAEIGTTYHEAFEAVWAIFLDTNEKLQVIDEFRSRPGSFIERTTGAVIKYSAATEYQLKEQLAEEFRDYVLNGKLSVKPVKNKNFIYRFFKSLVDFVKKFFTSPEAKTNTDELFDKIEAGYFKTATPLIYSEDPAYRDITLDGFDMSSTYKIIQGVTAEVFQTLLHDQGPGALLSFDDPSISRREVYQQVYDILEKVYTTDEYPDSVLNLDNEVLRAQYMNIWNSISRQWDNVIELTDEYLKTFGVNVVRKRVSGEDIEVQEDDIIENTKEGMEESEESDISSRTDTYLRNYHTFDFIKNSSASVRLLIGTLTESQFASTQVNTPFGIEQKLDPATYMTQLVESSKVFTKLMTNLHKTNSMGKKKEIIEDMGKMDPTFMRLALRLYLDEDFKNFDQDKWFLWLRFLNTFSKQKPEALIEFVGESGTTIVPQNTNLAIKDIVQSWIDGWKVSDNKFVKIAEDGQYYFDGSSFSDIPFDKASDKTKFLESIGIPFTYNMYRSIPKDEKVEFDEAVVAIKNVLTGKRLIQDLTPKGLGIDKRLATIGKYYFSGENENYESTFSNITGEQAQQFILPNAVSKILNDINEAASLEELYKTHPEYQQLFQSDSLYLNKILFTSKGNKRKGAEINIAHIQGIRDILSGKTTKNSKITQGRRLLHIINANISGYYTTIVPADSSTEWMLKMGNPFSFEQFTAGGLSTINNDIRRYFDTEKKIATKPDGSIDTSYNGLVFPLFADENGNFLSFKVEDFIRKESDKIKLTLSQEGIITINRDGTYTIEGLLRNFANDKSLKSMSEEELDTFLSFIVGNYMINNIEMHKLFFGDRNNIALKRYKSFLSPSEQSQDSEELNNFLNKFYNTVKGENKKSIKLKKGTPGYHKAKSHINTVVYQDVYTETTEITEDKYITNTKIKDAYKKNNISDGQAVMMLPAFIEAQIKRSGIFTRGQSRQFDYMMALDRLNIDADTRNNLLPKELQWTYTNQELKKRDEYIVAKGDPLSGEFAPLKPLVAGQAYTKDSLERFSILDKYSIQASSYSMYRDVDDKGNVKLRTGALAYMKMLKNGIDYFIYESGRKVGAKDINNFYNEDGSFDVQPYKGTTVIPYEYFGIQQETQGSKKKAAVGKQLTYLDKSNIMKNGVPKDVKGMAFKEWNSLSQKEKEDKSDLYKYISENNKALDELRQAGYDDLLDKFGIVDNGDSYELTDMSKVEELLQDELFRREASANKKDAIRIDPATNDFILPFEATAAYQDIKNIMFSYVDKLIAKPKVNGGQFIEVSHSGFEFAGKRVKKSIIKTKDGDREVYTSEGLKFYSAEYDKDGKRIKVNKMQVLLPNFMRDLLGKDKSDKEILDYLKNTEEGRRILTGVGFRIPTQELNSIEVFEVVGFLPKSMGQSIVLPDAITTKAGSDFDIDKLNVYLKNVYIGEDGYPRLVEFEDIDTNSKEALTAFYNKHLANRYSDDFIAEVQGDSAYDIPNLEDFIADNLGIDTYELNRLYNRHPYKEVIENKYFESIEKLILLPDNFERLITPNSKADLEAVKDKLVEAAPDEFGIDENTSPLSLSDMSNLRHIYMVAKGGVGIAALAQTNNALNQLGLVIINPNNVESLESYQQDIFDKYGVNIKLPHNKVKAGNKEYATISNDENIDGKFISNQISQYIDGFVDVANSPFIAQIIQNPSLISTFMFMQKVGMKMETIGYFMNQPIIREYIKYLAIKNTTWLYNENNIKRIKNTLFPISESQFDEEPDVDIYTSDKALLDNIKQYYTGTKLFSIQQNIEQRNILNEFLKYSVFAQNMTDLTIGLAYDNARMSEPSIRQYVESRTNRALNKNIFANGMSVVENSQVAATMSLTGDASDIINKLFFKTSSPEVESPIRSVLQQLINIRGLSVKNYRDSANRVVYSFMDYMLQTNQGLNALIEKLVFSKEQAVAIRLNQIKQDVRRYPDSDLANNIMIKYLITKIGDYQADPKTIGMIFRSNKPFQSDMYRQALFELKTNPIVQEKYNGLYDDLILLGLLQTGTGRGASSYNQYIPFEDYARVVEPIFSNMSSYDNIDNFFTNDVFFRSEWQNKDIVPQLVSNYIIDEETSEVMGMDNIYNPPTKEADTKNWWKKLLESKGFESTGTANKLYKLDYRKKESSNPVISMRVEMGNPYDEEYGTFYKNVLLRRLEDANGNPIKVHYYKKGIPTKHYHYIYYPINAWGNGWFGQESYNDNRQSVYKRNGYLAINEISKEDILQAYYEATMQPVSEKEDDVPEGEYKKINLSLQKENILKILAGSKTTTVRSATNSQSIGLKKGQSGILTLRDNQFLVTNRGLLTIEEAGGKDAILKSEDVESVDKLIYQQTKNWINGKGKMVVYDIKPYNNVDQDIVEQNQESSNTSLESDVDNNNQSDIDESTIGFEDGPC